MECEERGDEDKLFVKDEISSFKSAEVGYIISYKKVILGLLSYGDKNDRKSCFYPPFSSAPSLIYL